MAASYPTAVKSFTTKTDGAGQTIFAAHVNDIQDEVAAIESDLINGLAHLRLGGTTLTIAAGVVTNVKSLHAIDTEAAAASDDLDTITAGTGVNTGHLLIVYAANAARVVTVKDATGNIQLSGGDYALDSAKKSIVVRYDGTNWVEVARASTNATVDNKICDGRLTLTSGTPVTTGDVTAAGTLYFAPYTGNRIALYDGSSLWNQRAFTQLSLALTLTSGKPYDVFVYDNAGTPTLEVLVWTNDTTRATALTTQDGVLVKTGATTRRYVGTIYASGANTTEDSAAKRYVWNYYNRVTRFSRVVEATDTWSYVGGWRQANAAAANQLDFVIGVAEVLLHVEARALVANSGGGLHYAGIGEDSTSAPTAGSLQSPTVGIGASPSFLPASAVLVKYPAVGRHFYAWLEKGPGAGTGTWAGDNGDNTLVQTGIYGRVDG